MKFCPLRSTAEKTVECSHDCAFFAENEECAIKNLGNVSINNLVDSIKESLDDIHSEIYELRYK